MDSGKSPEALPKSVHTNFSLRIDRYHPETPIQSLGLGNCCFLSPFWGEGGEVASGGKEKTARERKHSTRERNNMMPMNLKQVPVQKNMPRGTPDSKAQDHFPRPPGPQKNSFKNQQNRNPDFYRAYPLAWQDGNRTLRMARWQ